MLREDIYIYKMAFKSLFVCFLKDIFLVHPPVESLHRPQTFDISLSLQQKIFKKILFF